MCGAPPPIDLDVETEEHIAAEIQARYLVADGAVSFERGKTTRTEAQITQPDRVKMWTDHQLCRMWAMDGITADERRASLDQIAMSAYTASAKSTAETIRAPERAEGPVVVLDLAQLPRPRPVVPTQVSRRVLDAALAKLGPVYDEEQFSELRACSQANGVMGRIWTVARGAFTAPSQDEVLYRLRYLLLPDALHPQSDLKLRTDRGLVAAVESQAHATQTQSHQIHPQAA